MKEISSEIQRIWQTVKDVEIPFEISKSTLFSELERRTIITLREALIAKPPRIGYLDPTSEWSIWQMCKRIRKIPPIPTSEIKVDAANKYRPLFDNEMRKLLDREMRLLVTYRVLSEIEPESIFEIEKTVKDMNHKTTRINQIELELKRLEDDINLTRRKEEILYTDQFHCPVEFFPWSSVYRAICPSHLRHIPISSWKDTVEKGTERINVSYEGDLRFPVISFDANLLVSCRGKVDFYAKGLDIPAVKVQLERNLRWRDILVEERGKLLETPKSKKQEIEERKSDLFTIARACGQVASMMNNTWEEQMKEYQKLVMGLWNTSAGRPTGIRQVDEFLVAFEEYLRAKDNRKRRAMTIEDISKLASYARAWLESNGL
jgi:hypothetical protein